jgi:hypothetical protein
MRSRTSCGLPEAVPQALPHVLAQGVHRRVVDGQHGHAAAALEIDGLADRCHGLLSSVSGEVPPS